MKKLLFYLLIFLLSIPSAHAFEDTAEHYINSPSEEWVKSAGGYEAKISLISSSDPTSIPGNVVIYFESTHYADAYMVSTTPIYAGYISWIHKGGVRYRDGAYKYEIWDYDTNTTLVSFYVPQSTAIPPNTKVEIIISGSYADLYLNGTLSQSVVQSGIDIGDKVRIAIGTSAGGQDLKSFYIDDITSSSIIGIAKLYNEANSNILFTWSSQLMRSYTNQQQVTLYSLTNTNNTGEVHTWNIPQDDNSTGLEHGYLVFPRSSIMGNDFGLYMLEMTRGSDILTDQYFYYGQLSDSQGYPELLFLAESDVNTEIRDEDNNGGEIDSGGAVYLYPDVQADGTYNFTYEILETPYAIKTELSTVYNNTALNSTTINYSGLSNQNYKISVDGAEVRSTNGADTYSYTFTDWSTETNHIISFAPDYTLAGVWGEVKNSETQEGIKSATVSVSGENFSKTLYTDDNGLFYLTKGLEAGKTYTISVSKTGYSTPPSQTAITVEGSTTRQDFYLDKLSTSGSGIYYAPHDVAFTVREYWYSGAGLTGVNYAIYNGTESIKTGTTDSKGMFTGSDLTGGTNYTIILTHNGTTYTEYIEPSLSEYTFVLNKEGILHKYANPWLTISYTEKSQNVTVSYESNKTITGASLTAIAGNGTTVYAQTLNTTSGSFLFETGGEGDYTLNFHIQATDGNTASQSWGLSYPNKVPLFPDSYPAWLKNILFSGIVMVFLLAFGKSKNDIACGAVAILTSMGYIFEWFTGSFYFVVLVWIIALGAVFLHYKRTGGIG